MISLTLLTGFLGAGKTTLLQGLLDAFDDGKTGVIVNEFGRTSVDGALLARDGVPRTDLSNGSIFCACIKENFLRGLIEMSRLNITRLFIEASGLADPSEMTRLLAAIAPRTEREYDYRGAVCVIDPQTFTELSEVFPALRRQVEYSGAAIINKSDLVGGEQLAGAAALALRLNPGCEIITTSYCRFDVKGLLSRLKPVDKPPADSTNTEETRPRTFILRPLGTAKLEELVAFTQTIAAYAYRIKGFLPTETGIVALSAAAGRVETAPWHGEPPQLGLTVISAVGIRIINRIAEALDGPLKDKLGF